MTGKIILYLSVFSPLLPMILHSFKIDGSIIIFSNIFIFIEFLFVSFYYRDKIFNKQSSFYIFLAAISTVFVADTLAKSIRVFNNYGAALFDFTCIVYGILGLYTMLKEQKTLFLSKSDFFWVNVALMVYCTGNFLIFLSDAYFSEINKQLQDEVWIFHNILNILFSILIAKSIACLKDNKS
jgi:hypothetical protein